MSTVSALAALADPTRRAVFEALAVRGPQTVTQLAAQFPVSRPAVSQHLRSLEAAGLVTATPRGRERVYAADRLGLDALHGWLDQFWHVALDGFAEHVRRGGPMTTTRILPVRKSVEVPLEPADAFALFTDRIEQWWPVETHSITASEEPARDQRPRLEFEGRVGGRLLETTPAGKTCSWGEVLAWDPPNRVVLSWHPGTAPVAASRLEVRFEPIGTGTRVLLEHSGWEEFGEQGEELRKNYDLGWEPVLARLVDAAS